MENYFVSHCEAAASSNCVRMTLITKQSVVNLRVTLVNYYKYFKHV